jgi:hypothetical protein
MCTRRPYRRSDNEQSRTQTQKIRVLNWLSASPLTRLEASSELNILALSPRINELRNEGHNIETEMVLIDPDDSRSSLIARYILIEGE